MYPLASNSHSFFNSRLLPIPAYFQYIVEYTSGARVDASKSSALLFYHIKTMLSRVP